jgi:mono/diheme cytochrome c family protein
MKSSRIPTRLISALSLICAVVLKTTSLPAFENTASTLTFEKDVRPILKAHCFLCHGEEADLKGKLDLRLVRLIQQGGESGTALVPGDHQASLLVERIQSNEMPPGSKKLSEAEKETIQKWIEQGAKTARAEPENPDDAKYTEEELSFWAWQPVRVTEPPQPAGYAIANPIDGFLAAALARQSLRFSPEADRSTLIRRVTLDLTGLPPSPAEVRAFVDDSSADAWEKVVDRLLSSPQYGVRWGRHWLDIAGYAESDGNQGKDHERPYAWHYRDYVIQAMNDDKPFDQFLVEQLAGDELIEGTADGNNPRHVELLAATGFLRMAPDTTQTENGIPDRNQAVAETLKVVGTSVLGLTVGCAQCHDHRYDPISIEDYYRFRSVFDPAFPLQTWKQPAERLTDMTDAACRDEIARIEAEAVAQETDIRNRRRAYCQMIQDKAIQNAPEAVRESLRTAVNTPADKQTAEQKSLLDAHPTVRTIDWIIGQLIEYDMPAYRRFEEEEKKVAEIRKTKPQPRMVMNVQESVHAVPVSTVFFRGDPMQPAKPVTPGELHVLTAGRPAVVIPEKTEGKATTGRRLAYAKQLTDGTHPLTARVAVNRMWRHHFGRGLVKSVADFGTFGDHPSHPELLDWLADDFVQNGWKMKRLHKLIVMTTAYRQTSQRNETLNQVDPENRLLGRMNLQRLEAEAIRDAILTATGKINLAITGASVPVSEDGEGKAVIGRRILRDGLFSHTEPVGDQEFRRSLFLSSVRSLPLNMLDTFDLPMMSPNCVQRTFSTAAPQSLLFLNDTGIVTLSDGMAEQLFSAEFPDAASRVHEAFLRLFARAPDSEELQESLNYVTEQSAIFRNDPTKEWQETLAKNAQAADVRAFSSLCQMLMASNRFLYVD